MVHGTGRKLFITIDFVGVAHPEPDPRTVGSNLQRFIVAGGQNGGIMLDYFIQNVLDEFALLEGCLLYTS